MKQNIIIVTVLAALSMVNGIPLQLHKRATTFAACPAGSPTPLEVIITPDPPAAGGEVTSTITGTPSAEIADGANLVFSILDQADALQGKAVTTPFCTAEGVTCPVAAGTAFTATQPVTLPETLPEGPYKLQVAIVDAAGASIGCSVGTVTDAAAPADGAPAGGDDGAEPPADGDDGAEPPAGGDDAPADDAPADDAPADDAPADDAPADDA